MWSLGVFKVAVSSSLIKVMFKYLPACFNGERSFAAAALHVLQIVHAPAVSAFLPDTFLFFF